MIDGVNVKKLKIITDERGFLMEILRDDDSIFKKFGQTYITCVKKGCAKAWHYHKKQTDHFTCLKGKARVVLFDGREGSRTKGELQEFIMSLEDPFLLQIPPGVYHGFEVESGDEAIILNVPTEHYVYKSPDEYRLPFDTPQIPYKWKSKKGG